MFSVQTKKFRADCLGGTLVYAIEECVATCRNGIILKARVVEWPIPGGPEFVAIKQLNGNLDDQVFEKEFQKRSKQIKYIEKLRHANILRYYAAFKISRSSDTETNKICILMDYYLADLEKFSRTHEWLHTSSELVCQIILGLSYLHSNGIVHFDLKPANILVSEEDYCKMRIIICDLDESAIVGKEKMDDIDIENFVGTTMYYSPEMGSRIASRESNQKVGYKTDIWSLGCVLLDIAAGSHNRVIIGDDGPQLESSLGESVSVKASSGILSQEFDHYMHQITSGGVPSWKTGSPIYAEWADLIKLTSACLKRIAAERCGLDLLFSCRVLSRTYFCNLKGLPNDLVYLEQMSGFFPKQYVQDLHAVIDSNLKPKEKYIVAIYPDTDWSSLPESIRSVRFIGFDSWTSDILKHNFFASAENLDFVCCNDLVFRSGSPRYPSIRSLTLTKSFISDVEENVMLYETTLYGMSWLIAPSYRPRPYHQLPPEFKDAFPMPQIEWSDVIVGLAHFGPLFDNRHRHVNFESVDIVTLRKSPERDGGLLMIRMHPDLRFDDYNDPVKWESVKDLLTQLSQIIDGHPCGLEIHCNYFWTHQIGSAPSDFASFGRGLSRALSPLKTQIVTIAIEDDGNNGVHTKKLLPYLEMPHLLEMTIRIYSGPSKWAWSSEDFTMFQNLRILRIHTSDPRDEDPVKRTWHYFWFIASNGDSIASHFRHHNFSNDRFDEGDIWVLKANGYWYRNTSATKY